MVAGIFEVVPYARFRRTYRAIIPSAGALGIRLLGRVGGWG